MPAKSSDSASEYPARSNVTVDAGTVEAGVMAQLLAATSGHVWTRAELELMIGASALDVSDALAELQASGLIHINGELVTVSRAAQRLDELDL